MKKFYELYGKSQWLTIKGEIITDASCSCEDFHFRHLKKEGDKVKVVGLCKHIKRLICRYYIDKKVIINGTHFDYTR